MGKGAIHVSDQKRLEERQRVSCSLAHTVLSARSVFVFGVRTETSRAGCWPELPRKKKDLVTSSSFITHVYHGPGPTVADAARALSKGNSKLTVQA